MTAAEGLELCRNTLGLDETDLKIAAIWNKATRMQQLIFLQMASVTASFYAGAPWHEIPAQYRGAIKTGLIDLRERLTQMLPPDRFPKV